MHMDHELIEQTKRLNHATQHDIAALKTLYSNDFLIHRVNDLGETMTFDKQTTIAFFENNHNADEPHQDDIVEFLHASKSGDVGMVVGKRNMQIGNQLEELLFTQIWRSHAIGWQMIRESIAAKLANSNRALKN
jgi:hypothetical protein